MSAIPSPLEEEDVTAPVAYERRDNPSNYNELARDAFWNLKEDDDHGE